MTQPTAFFFDELCLWHTTGQHALTLPVGGWTQPPSGAGHAESPESKRRFKNLMDVSGLSRQLALRGARSATEEDLRRVHDPRYLERFKAASDAGGGEIGDTAPFGAGSYEIAKMSAGLALAAVDGVLAGEYANAYALSRPPGHHCLADRAMGFCLLANIPIAIEAAKAKYGIERVAVVDWDVHHGNGTQSIYYERSDVFTVSLHQDGCFPPGYSGFADRGAGAGLGANLNVPLQAGSGHAEYLYAMKRVVVPALERFRPDLIVVASGFDANAVDPLARMQAHSETFRAMTAAMMEVADRHCGGKLVIVHEGGYAESYVPFCGHAVVEQLSGIRTAVEDPMLDFIRVQQPTEAFHAFQRELVDDMARALDL